MDASKRLEPPIPCAPAPAPPGDMPQRIDSALLLRGANELLIDHRGVLYRLRQTALGKLILTK
jgi:hemin uptake protein HemP